MADSSPLPTERLVISYDAEEVEALRALHAEAEGSYPEPPPQDLLARISEAEDAIASSANAQVRTFASALRAEGKRPWFEVWYPVTTPDDFDAVEVSEDGSIITLPPYDQLRGGD